MCLIKIIKTEYVEEQVQDVEKPIKAKNCKNQEFKIEQVLNEQPRTEVKYYLFGFILVCKLVYMKRKGWIKSTYKVLD